MGMSHYVKRAKINGDIRPWALTEGHKKDSRGGRNGGFVFTVKITRVNEKRTRMSMFAQKESGAC